MPLNFLTSYNTVLIFSGVGKIYFHVMQHAGHHWRLFSWTVNIAFLLRNRLHMHIQGLWALWCRQVARIGCCRKAKYDLTRVIGPICWSRYPFHSDERVKICVIVCPIDGAHLQSARVNQEIEDEHFSATAQKMSHLLAADSS